MVSRETCARSAPIRSQRFPSAHRGFPSFGRSALDESVNAIASTSLEAVSDTCMTPIRNGTVTATFSLYSVDPLEAAATRFSSASSTWPTC